MTKQDRLTRHISIDPDTGLASCDFEFFGEKVYSYKITPDPGSRAERLLGQVCGFFYIGNDLQRLILLHPIILDRIQKLENAGGDRSNEGDWSMLKNVTEEQEAEVFLQLAGFACIYGRIFNRGRFRFLQDASISKDLLSIHKEILELRNTYFAHRESSIHERASVYLVKNPRKISEQAIETVSNSTATMASKLFSQAGPLLNHLMSVVKAKYENKKTMLLNEISPLPKTTTAEKI